MESYKNQVGTIQLGTPDGISIPITAYMGHQREKGENKN
jgi:hypothetical protein